MKKIIITMFGIAIVCLAVILGVKYFSTSNAVETTLETIVTVTEVEQTTESVTESNRYAADIVLENEDEFIPSNNAETVYPVDPKARYDVYEYMSGVYVRTVINITDAQMSQIVLIMDTKKVERPWTLEGLEENFIYISKDGVGYGFDFKGNQSGTDDYIDNEDVQPDIPLEIIETETSPENDGIEAPGVFEDIYTDTAIWLQLQLYGKYENVLSVYATKAEDTKVYLDDSATDKSYVVTMDEAGNPITYEEVGE